MLDQGAQAPSIEVQRFCVSKGSALRLRLTGSVVQPRVSYDLLTYKATEPVNRNRSALLLTRHTGDPDVIGWSALETTLAGLFLPLLSERGKCVAVPASSSGDVETSMEVTTNER